MSSLDYLDLCRLCLVKDRVSVPIFEGEGDVRQIFLKIAACLPVKVGREDKLPKKICDDCVYKVELFYQFWNTTANAEKQLLQWLGEVSLDDKQGYVTGPHPSLMKPGQNPGENRLDGSVMQQVNDHPNNMGMGMLDSMGMGMPMMISTSGQQQQPQQQMTSVPMDTGGVQTVQAVPGPSTQSSHDQITQQKASGNQEDDEDESEEDENSDDECDGDDGLPVKEESEEDPNSSRTIEPTTFVNVSLACDEAGPSGLQQQKIGEMPEMVMPPTDGDPKSGSGRTGRSGKKSRAAHKCGKCNGRFFHMTKLVEHLKNAHGIERAFHCDECGKAFRSPSNITRHKLIHTGQKKFVCDLCGWACNQKSNLDFHHRRHVKDYAFSCEPCAKGFLLKTEYDEHMENIHTEQKKYNCEICLKTYGYKRNLNAHMRANHIEFMGDQIAEIKFTCKLCPRGFAYVRHLTNHMKKRHGIITTKVRQFLCDLCGTKVSSKKALDIHRRTHTGEIVASCDICGKGFCNKESLKIHRRIHTGERPYVCNLCGKDFTQRTSLVIHMRYHNDERPYQCLDCGKGFVSGTFLKKHKETHCNIAIEDTTNLNFTPLMNPQ